VFGYNKDILFNPRMSEKSNWKITD